MEPRIRFQGMNSASLCSLAGRYDNPIPPRFLAPIDFLKIPAQYLNSLGLSLSVLRIRDDYPEFRILDLTFFHPGSRIRIKEFKYFNPKK
jgi:hypothetical protein